MSEGEDDAPTLVVLVNNEADWRHIVDDGWYRIPLKHAPHPVAASYLAFYQSRVFGDDAFHIRYYAPVRRYRTVTRRELLPDQPDHPRADERYYQIELGPLITLQHPIPSRRLRRITFIPTTLRRLLEADEINDLWLDDDVEEMLWSLFRDAGLKAERRLEIGEGKQRYIVPIAVTNGTKPGVAVFCNEPMWSDAIDGWRMLHFPPALARSSPDLCLDQLRAALDTQNTRAQ